jgi:hypothetical protein
MIRATRLVTLKVVFGTVPSEYMLIVLCRMGVERERELLERKDKERNGKPWWKEIKQRDVGILVTYANFCLFSITRALYAFMFCSWLLSQSSPSYSPSPEVAHVDCVCHRRWRRLCSPSLSVTSEADMAFGRS